MSRAAPPASARQQPWAPGSAPLVPVEHTIAGGRTLTFPAGSSLDAMFATMGFGLGAGVGEQATPVGFPAAGVAALRDLLFAGNNVTTSAIIAVAEKYAQHPDSARKILKLMWTKWLQRAPHLTFISHHVAAPDRALTDRANSSQAVTVEFPRDRRVPAEPTALSKFITADSNNYVYRPEEQSAGELRIAVYSHQAKYSDASLTAFEACLYHPKALDLAWCRSMQTAMAGTMSAKCVTELCGEILVRFKEANTAGLDICIYFQRERKIKVMRLDPRATEFRLAGVAIANEMARVEAATKAVPAALCLLCGVGMRSLRCAHCGELRYCQELCRDVDWEQTHQNECKVYLKKTRSMPQAPGGAPVMRNTVKSKNQPSVAAASTPAADDDDGMW